MRRAVQAIVIAAGVTLAALGAACAVAPPKTPAAEWHQGPGGIQWINVGDGTRCYYLYSADSLQCLRVQP